MNKKDLTAPCGLDCFNCELYSENLTEKLQNLINEKFGVPREQIACQGCRQQAGKHFHLPEGNCATLDCIKSKQVDFCFECSDFPCQLLAPLADSANKYPHNMKLYNLCRMQKVGIDHWIENEAGKIRKKYFNLPFKVGKGHIN